MVATAEDYPEVQGLLTRFETLKGVITDLKQAQLRDETEMERLRTEFNSYTKERRVILLLYTLVRMGPRGIQIASNDDERVLLDRL